MTAKLRNTLWLTIGGPLLIALLTWGFVAYDTSKVGRVEYTRDVGRLDAKLDRVLDVVCDIKQARACAAP